MELTERTVSSQTIFQGRIIRVDMDQVELPDGKTANREVVYHPSWTTGRRRTVCWGQSGS